MPIIKSGFNNQYDRSSNRRKSRLEVGKSFPNLQNIQNIQNIQNLKNIKNLKNLQNKIKKLLPDPNHPWRNPLKNTPFKWYELIDISSGSEDSTEGEK